MNLASLGTDSRLDACFALRKHYRPYVAVAGGLECISYPFPDDHGGISIMIRGRDDSTTLRAVGIPDSEWLLKKRGSRDPRSSRSWYATTADVGLHRM